MRVRILSLFLCGVLLTGCGSTAVAASTNVSSDTASLQAEIKELQTENEMLKKQLNDSSTEVTSSDISNESTETDTTETDTIVEDEYIKNNLVMSGAKVEKYTGYDGDHVGLGGISIKNKGDKNIAKIYVTVYFQDKNGKDIFDSDFIVVGNIYDFQGQNELKANYSFKMESDTYYTIDNISDEVDITKYRVEISKIEFE